MFYSKCQIHDHSDNMKLKTIQQLCDEWHIVLTNK
jgi:hypothetical protein